MAMNHLVRSAWDHGGLRSIARIEEIAPLECNETIGFPNLQGFFMFDGLVGYRTINALTDLPDEYFLEPGLLSSYSNVFQSIHVGNADTVGIDDSSVVGQLRHENRFKILGIYAHACNILADILEAELKAGPVIPENKPEQADRISALSREGFDSIKTYANEPPPSTQSLQEFGRENFRLSINANLNCKNWRRRKSSTELGNLPSWLRSWGDLPRP